MKIFKTIKEKILYEKDEIITGIVFFIVLGAICAWIVSCEIKSGKIINPKTFIIYNIEDLKRKAKLNLKNQRIRIMERMEIYYSDLSKEAQK